MGGLHPDRILSILAHPVSGSSVAAVIIVIASQLAGRSAESGASRGREPTSASVDKNPPLALAP